MCKLCLNGVGYIEVSQVNMSKRYPSYFLQASHRMIINDDFLFICNEFYMWRPENLYIYEKKKVVPRKQNCS